MQAPVKGKCYTHTDLGFKFPENLTSFAEQDGIRYLFVTIKHEKGWTDELHSDGLVHAQDEKHEEYLVKGLSQCTDERGRFVMVRYFPDSHYLCIGEIDYVERYDTKRNKVFIKD
jgi:hypothetical protein